MSEDYILQQRFSGGTGLKVVTSYCLHSKKVNQDIIFWRLLIDYTVPQSRGPDNTTALLKNSLRLQCVTSTNAAHESDPGNIGADTITSV